MPGILSTLVLTFSLSKCFSAIGLVKIKRTSAIIANAIKIIDYCAAYTDTFLRSRPRRSNLTLPSTFANHTGRPEKYMSLHFANSIWKNNTAEVMVHTSTDEKYFNEVVEFANDIRMVALPIRKEKSGYLLNSMLVPFLLSGLDLYVNGISDPQSIDKAWTLGTGAPRGPFQIFDVVGIQTAYNIVLQYQKVPGLFSPLLKKMMLPYNFKAMEKVLRQMLDEGKTGKSAGEGFYKY